MLFENNNKEITPELINYYITESKARHKEIYNLYLRYKAEKDGTPILQREYKLGDIKRKDKINNKINNDFFGEIIDMKVGFFTGVPITYTLEKSDYIQKPKQNIFEKIKSAVGISNNLGEAPDKKNEMVNPQYEIDNEFIENFNKINSISDLDAETSKRAAICGFCGRLLYIEENTGELKIIIRDPWKCIFIGTDIQTPDYSIYYYSQYQLDGKNNKTEKCFAFLYDKYTIKEFQKNDKEENYKLVNENTHPFGYNPLIGFANNDELQGDAEKVLAEIDAYDRSFSDVNNEIEQFRLAYMVATGCMLPDKVIEDAQRTGAFSLNSPNSSLTFLTKDLNDNIIEHHLDRLEKNIYRFSKTPNIRELSMAGNITGIAMQFGFRAFEYKCINSELKFKKSLRQQYKILSEIWNAQGAQINYLDIEFIFTRNYPQNLLEQAQIQQTLKGLISDKTRLSLASFISDPEKEMENMEHDMIENASKFLMQQDVAKNNSNSEKNDMDSQDDKPNQE